MLLIEKLNSQLVNCTLDENMYLIVATLHYKKISIYIIIHFEMNKNEYVHFVWCSISIFFYIIMYNTYFYVRIL